MLKNFVKNNNLLNSIYFKYKKANKIFKRESLSFIEQNNRNQLDLKKFNNKITDINYENIIIDSNINSVAGWVPYIKNKTNIVIYNFFSSNYSLRNILLVRLSIIEGLKLNYQTCFWLPINSVHEIQCMKICKDVIGNSAIIEFFHPKIKKNHGGHDGHLRFWGKYYSQNNNYMSTVHSMPFPKKNPYAIKSTKSRSYNLDLVKHNNYIYSLGHSKQFDKFYSNTKQLAGFNVSLDKNNDPGSVFHLAPFNKSSYKELGSNSKEITQAFWVPHSRELDPLIVVDNLEIGVKDKNKLKFYLVQNNNIIQKTVIDVNGFFSKKVSEIFSDINREPYVIMCNFSYNNFGYIHVHYNSKSMIGDQVHAHTSYWDCENNLTPKIIKTRGSARKFLHVYKNLKKNLQHYLLINLHKVENIAILSLKIRAFSDTGKEFIKNYEFQEVEPIKVFDLQKEFSFFFADIRSIGVIQIESNDDNFDGSLLYQNLETDTISVDHLTGG